MKELFVETPLIIHCFHYLLFLLCNFCCCIIYSLTFSYTTLVVKGSRNLIIGISIAMAVAVLLGVLLTTFIIVAIYCRKKGQLSVSNKVLQLQYHTAILLYFCFNTPLCITIMNAAIKAKLELLLQTVLWKYY